MDRHSAGQQNCAPETGMGSFAIITEQLSVGPSSRNDIEEKPVAFSHCPPGQGYRHIIRVYPDSIRG